MKENGLKYVTFSTAKGAPEVALAVKNAFFLYDLHISLFLFAIFIFLFRTELLLSIEIVDLVPCHILAQCMLFSGKRLTISFDPEY